MTYAPSFCPNKIIFVPDKIVFVPDKIKFVPDKIFCPRLKGSYLLGKSKADKVLLTGSLVKVLPFMTFSQVSMRTLPNKTEYFGRARSLQGNYWELRLVASAAQFFFFFIENKITLKPADHFSHQDHCHHCCQWCFLFRSQWSLNQIRHDNLNIFSPKTSKISLVLPFDKVFNNSRLDFIFYSKRILHISKAYLSFFLTNRNVLPSSRKSSHNWLPNMYLIFTEAHFLMSLSYFRGFSWSPSSTSSEATGT